MNNVNKFVEMSRVHTTFENILYILKEEYEIPDDAIILIKLLITISADKATLKINITDDELKEFAQKSIFNRQSASSQPTLRRYRDKLKDFLQQPNAKAFVDIEQSESTVQGFTTYDLNGLATVIDQTLAAVPIQDLLHNKKTHDNFVTVLKEQVSRLKPASVIKRKSAEKRTSKSKYNF